MPDGSDFDSEELLTPVRSGNNPFSWDVDLFIQEIEENSAPRRCDILTADKGSNNYVSSGLHAILMRFHADTEVRRCSGLPPRTV